MSEGYRQPDFRVLFESAPGLYMVLDPQLRIVAASDAYLEATLTRRADIIGRHVFDVFPDNPADPSADAVGNSSASFKRVLELRITDFMGLQRHDVRKPEAEGGGWEVRYWSAVNSPVLNPDGSVAYIFHRVENVTELALLQSRQVEQARVADLLRAQAAQMQAEIAERTRIEEALRDSEMRYRTLFDSIDEGYCIIEVIFDENRKPVDYRLIEANTAFEKQTGLVGARGKLMREMVPGHEEHWFEIYGQVALTGQSARFENRADQLGRWYDVFAYRFGAPDKRQVAVLFNDIKERKLAEMALREGQARQEFLLRLTDALRSLADPLEIQFEASRVLGEHLGADRAGYAESEDESKTVFINRHYTNGLPGVEGRHNLDDYGATLASDLLSGRALVRDDISNDPGLTDAEKRAFAILPVGAMADVPLVKAGCLVAVLFVHYRQAHAFTSAELSLIEAVAERTWAAVERARAEAALRESEQRYRALFQSMQEGFAVGEIICTESGEPVDWRYLDVNPAFECMFGRKRDEVVGRRYRELFPNAPWEYWAPRLGRVALTGEPAHLEHFGQDVRRHYEAIAYSPRHGQFAAIFADVTERKRAEDRLRQSQKLESVGLLAGGIAHDFNNLLTGIMGNASMVLDDVDRSSAERIKEVIASAERAANLTRQLLAYSGKGQFILRDLNISEVVNEIAGLVEFSIPKSIQLAVSVQRRLPVVRMDPSQLQQILMNLVINAGEAIGEGNPGTITVATSMTDVGEPFLDSVGHEVAAGRYVRIEVSDTGHGIDKDARSKIFDPFFTTKFTGRGLGLAAVAGILRSQKGGITVESDPGRGATFRVFLPAASGQPAPIQEKAGSQGRGTVLVVDDEAAVRDFIGAVLRRQGYSVLLAADGRDALSLCKQHNGQVDAAILDVVMPIMGANELMPALKSLRPDMRILLTSGYSETEARRLCAAYPGAAFIQKPYTAQQITRAVDELLGVVRS